MEEVDAVFCLLICEVVDGRCCVDGDGGGGDGGGGH